MFELGPELITSLGPTGGFIALFVWYVRKDRESDAQEIKAKEELFRKEREEILHAFKEERIDLRRYCEKNEELFRNEREAILIAHGRERELLMEQLSSERTRGEVDRERHQSELMKMLEMNNAVLSEFRAAIKELSVQIHGMTTREAA